MKFKTLFLTFFLIPTFVFAVLEENESFRNFLLGDAPGCAYDNWISHISEGIASPGYNLYAPWDRQTDGFGNFRIPTEEELAEWESVVVLFLENELETAQALIDTCGFPYQVVIFHDTDFDRTYHILREIPNMQYYDDNGTSSHYDDELGAFDYGWGLYVYYPNGPFPHITTAPHPNDDFTTVPFSYEVFTRQQSKFLLISGAGREVTWTEVSPYTNSKSTCDPSRVEAHPFNIAYQKFCDEIRDEFGHREFSIQVHGYDWGTRHPGYPNVQISGGHNVSSPDLPIRDHSSLKLDIVNATDFIVHPANDIGIHPAVFINDFYGIHYSQYDFTYDNGDTTFTVSNHIDLPGYSNNRQMIYTLSGFSHYDNCEPFFHIEMDELPNCYVQDTQSYYWFYGWDPFSGMWNLEHRFDNAIAYYLPWVNALASVLPAMYQMDDNEIPVAPTNLTVISSCADNIVLEWTPGDCYDMDSYEIFFAEEPITDNNYVIRDKTTDSRLATLSETHHTISGLTAGEDYYFQIRIRDKNGNYSSLSNEVAAITGPAKITNLKTIGRDGFVDISWFVPFQDSCLGFNVYRRSGYNDFELIDSWLTNPALGGQTEENVPYFISDFDVINGELYTYKISNQNYSGDEFFYGTLSSAQPQKIFQIYTKQLIGSFADTCYFGMNYFASDGFDAGTFDITTDDEASGDYFFCQFYEDNWNNNQELEQEIYADYNPNLSYKHWVYRFRTNQINQEVEIGISNLEERNTARFYLYKNGVWTNLSLENFFFTPTNTGFSNFDLYYGNLIPSVDFADFANQLLFPNEIVNFSWNINIQESIDYVNVYAANEEIDIPIESFLSPTETEVSWSVPALLFDNLHLKIDLIMAEGDTLSYYSPFKFGIITPQTIVATSAGWHLITKNYETSSYSPQEIYGEGSSLFEWMNDDFIQIDSPEFLHPYWLNAPEDNYITLTDADIQTGSFDFSMHQGWNIIPNPHRIDYDIQQLLFVFQNEIYEYYSALQNRMIEPYVFEFDGKFKPVSHLEEGKSYYLYCYEDNISLKFIPFYTNTVSFYLEDNWKLEISAAQNSDISSSVIVGTSDLATSSYDSYYDLLKPVDKPFEDIIFALPYDFNSDSTFTLYHQIMQETENSQTDFVLEWNASLQLPSSEQINFGILPENMPDNYYVYLQFIDDILELHSNEENLYNPSDSLLDFSILITNFPLSEVAENTLEKQISLRNYPNPFRTSTTISFELSTKQNYQNEGNTISIYNIKGQKIRQFSIPNSQFSIIWDGKDDMGKSVASGVYFYKLKTDNKTSLIKKMIMIK